LIKLKFRTNLDFLFHIILNRIAKLTYDINQSRRKVTRTILTTHRQQTLHSYYIHAHYKSGKNKGKNTLLPNTSNDFIQTQMNQTVPTCLSIGLASTRTQQTTVPTLTYMGFNDRPCNGKCSKHLSTRAMPPLPDEHHCYTPEYCRPQRMLCKDARQANAASVRVR